MTEAAANQGRSARLIPNPNHPISILSAKPPHCVSSTPSPKCQATSRARMRQLAHVLRVRHARTSAVTWRRAAALRLQEPPAA